MPFYVNLPLSYAAADERYLALFLDKGLHPELGIDAVAIETLPMSWHRQTAARLRDAGLTCGVHLPFHDLHPGSPDALIAGATRTRLAQALEIAALYAPRHMVGHAMYSTRLYNGLYEAWLEHSVETWRTTLAAWPEHPPLCLENVFESAPDTLAALVRAIDHPEVGVCFDVGHWHSFGGGAAQDDLEHWLDVLGPHIRHLHLHDNDGSGDQHSGIGRGTIPFDRLFAALEQQDLRPSVTFEPHTEAALADALACLAAQPGWFSRLL